MYEVLKGKVEEGLNCKVIEHTVYKGGEKITAWRLNGIIENGGDPVIYPDDISVIGFEKYIANIKKAIEETTPAYVDIAEWVKDFEKVKSRLFLALRPKTDDEKAVKRPFLDMEQYVRFEIDSPDKNNVTSATVNRLLMDIWQVSEDELFSIAETNTMKDITISNMADVLGITYISETMPKIMIVRTKRQLHGAAVMCCKEALETVREMIGDDYLILPSSLHEIIVMPSSNSLDRRYLIDVVTSINNTVLNPEDRLSDNVYMYYGELKIV